MKYLRFIIILLIPIICKAQGKKNTFAATLDYQILQHKSYSLGIGTLNKDEIHRRKEGWGLDFEYMPKDNNLLKNIYGLKIEAYTYKKYFNFGYGFGYFTDATKYKVIFIPEIGLGYKSIFLVYRRNLKIFGSNLDKLNKDNLSIRLYIPLNKDWFKIKK